MIIKNNIQFFARKGSPITDDEAQVYGERLSYLIGQNGEKPLTAEDIVSDGENIKSPLHNYFEWDDEIAGRNYRIAQARRLTSFIVMKVIDEKDETEHTTRFMVNVKSQDSGRGYVTLSNAINADDLRQQIIRRALLSLEHWKEQYKIYQELEPLVTAIDEFLSSN